MVISNLQSFEDQIMTPTTLTFGLNMRRVVITNDGGGDLRFKFHENESYATMLPSETLSFDVTTRKVFLDSTNTNYRVWGLG